MIVVKPMSGQTKIKVTGLYQWDKFQTLQFEDVYPSGTEVHFGIQGETVALVYLLENGSVRIPSVLLQRALPVMAWVHVGETTVLEIEMPVTPRAMPSDYIGIEDDTQHSIEYRTVQLEQWQVEAIKQMSNRYTKAETDKKLELKADANRVYTKGEANALLNEKADADTVYAGLTDRYTKAEADVLFHDRYTKAEADVLLNEKASVTELTEGLDDRYTKTETDAKSLKLKNLVTNGDFSQGMTGWLTQTDSTSVVSEGVLVNTANGTKQYGRISQHIESFRPVAGRKLYAHLAFTKLSGDSHNATVSIRNNYLGDLFHLSEASNPIIGERMSLSGSAETSTEFTEGLRLFIISNYSTDKDPTGGSFSVDNIVMIDLTETFGAGNEPTKAEMDKLIDIIGWFDGEITLAEKQLAVWTLNDIRLKANKQQGDWITPTLMNGWVSDPSNPIRYRKNQFGIVEFAGAIQNPSVNTSYMSPIPSGFRPKHKQDNLTVVGGTTLYQVQIAVTGATSIYGVPAGRMVFFNNVSYEGA